MFRSFGLTQKNQKVKAAPAGLLRFAAVGKWMKLASLKQHPFLFRPPLRFVSRPSAEVGTYIINYMIISYLHIIKGGQNAILYYYCTTI